VSPGSVVGIDIQAAPVERARAIAASHAQANLRFEVATMAEIDAWRQCPGAFAATTWSEAIGHACQ
jgi:hypothetical protein